MLRRSERRRLVVALFATVVAAPLLLVEVAPGAGASPVDPALVALAEALPAELESFELVEVGAESASEPVAPEPSAAPSPALADDVDPATALGKALDGPDSVGVTRASIAAEAKVEDETVDDEAVEVPADTTVPPTTVPPTTVPPTTVPPTTVPPTTAPPTTVPPTTVAPEPAASDDAGAVGPSPEQWARLRQCESGGSYTAINPIGYYGAYQFHPGTWDWVANRFAPHLAGVRPDQAAPADQDAMAQWLYDLRGAQPWPHCGRYLR